MGLWADTFGGGNSFTESVANVFTPNDGASYVGGTLTYDSGSNAGSVVPTNSSGGYGNDGNGNVLYSGSANSTSTNAAGAGSSGANPSYTIESGNVKGSAPTGIKNFSTTSIIGKIAGWANGLKPAEDKNEIVDGRAVYTSADGMQYSFNFLGMPYEVKVQGDKVVDALSIKGEDGMTGYERMAAEARANGNNDEADAIMQTAEENAQDGGEETTNVAAAVERYKAIAAASGIEVSNDDIKAMTANPEAFLAERGLKLADLVPTMNANAEGTNLDPNDPRYSTSDNVTYEGTQIDAATVDVPVESTIGTAATDTSADRLDAPQYNVDPVTGEIRAENLVNADEYAIDMKGSATGVNADGTTNYTGVALNDYATQNISKMIDTSTVAGKLLADKLGEGNYTDTKATILGQMKIISEEFKGPNGEPIIPPWAQGTYRNITRSISFNGMSGSAAIAASSNAIMEATLGIAEKEAAFFQTVTIKNLDNRQEAIINKANVLAKFDLANLSAREVAAVQNAKAFLDFDLSNLDRRQQAEVINVQNRVDAMFTDVAEENVNRRFNITNAMENRQFYDQLKLEAATYNASAINAARESNANRKDSATQFSIERTMARDQFEANMARYIDESNVNWRRSVYETNTRMEFEAAATDVRNAIGLTTEGLNRIWDRVDSQLDYIWRSTEADEQRDFELLVAEMNAAAAAASGSASAKGSIWGAILGGAATLGAAWIAKSDSRLKDNIEYYDTMPNGVKVYTWEWNEIAKKLGADRTPPFGVIAQEIMKTHPDAVQMDDDGYLLVNYGKIQ